MPLVVMGKSRAHILYSKEEKESAKRKATTENTNNVNKKSKIDPQVSLEKYQDAFQLNKCLLCKSTMVLYDEENMPQSVKLALIKWHYTECLFKQGAFSQLHPPAEVSSPTRMYQCFYTEHELEYKDYNSFCCHIGYSHGVTENLLRAKQPNIPHIENLLVQLYPEHQPDDMTWQDAELLKTHEICVLCHSTSTPPEKCPVHAYPEYYPPKTTWGDLTQHYQCIYENCPQPPMDYQWFCIHIATTVHACAGI